MCRNQNARRSHNMKVDNGSFERVEEFKYFGTILTNQNLFWKKLRADKSQGMLAVFRCKIFLSSSLLSKNFNIKIRTTIILPVVLYGCETWSRTLREERMLRVFEKGVMRRIFGPRRHEVTGQWRKLYNVDLNDLFTSSHAVRVIKSRRMIWAGHVARRGIGTACLGFW